MSRSSHFDQDKSGRTTLINAAAKGALGEVEKILFSLSGTGVSCERLALINLRDENGKTAIDAAKEAGHDDIVAMLEGEQGRMEYFE